MSAQARRVAAAEGVIRAAWKSSHVEPWHFTSVAAQALEDAGLLMSPEVAAELERLRARVAEPESAPRVRAPESVAKLRALLARQREERP
ncbi:hypothetical protein [Streptomyces sp. NPDC059928]|uniref:hypothetical protein n=1 Tax=unclassified Streptomyces TaxID=2593676 RepID=UPI00365F8FF1